MNAILKGWANALNIKGRASRKEYWMTQLSGVFAFLLSGVIILIVNNNSFISDLIHEYFLITLFGHSITVGEIFLTILVFSPILAFAIVSLTVSIRRMHDTGRSGFFILFPVLNIIALFEESEDMKNKYGNKPE